MIKRYNQKTLQNKTITKPQLSIMKRYMKEGWSLLYAASCAGLGHKGAHWALEQDDELKELNEKYKLLRKARFGLHV